jgi:WS/DGAT/MGAT family acyltransferase
MNENVDTGELFSSVDAAWLHMDSPTNLAVINGVMTFNRPLDFDRLQTTVKVRMLTYERFRKRVREPEGRFGLPVWEFDPDFSLDNHLLRDRLPSPGNHEVLQVLMGRLISIPLNPERPLWQLVYLENYNQGSALIGRLHHCIADGIALMQVLLSLADESPDAPWPQMPAPEPAEDYAEELRPLTRRVYPAVKLVKDARRAWQAFPHLVQQGIESVPTPHRLSEAARYGVKGTMALGKLVFILPDQKTIFKQKCGIEKRVAWSKAIQLEDVKAVGQKMGGTINDILLSAMTGALRRYLENRGDPVEGLDIRAVVPVNLRRPEEAGQLGNRFGLVFLSLPVGIRDPLRRLVTLRKRMDEIKDSPEAVVAIGILAGIGMTPIQVEQVIVSIFGLKGSAVMTNVPGPRKPLYLAGEQIDSFIFWVPTPANIGLGVSIFSYNGHVMIGFATDDGMVSDPAQIIQDFQDEFKQLQSWGRPPEKAVLLDQEAEEVVRTCQALTRAGKPCKNRAIPGSFYCRVHRQAEDLPAHLEE